MDPDNDNKSDNSADSVLLELAAHPLNSINPPPRDLPDLLDSLLLSEIRAKAKIDLCNQMTGDLVKQAGLIRRRSDDLLAANSHFESKTKLSEISSKNKEYRFFRLHSFLLKHMMLQFAFLISKFDGGFKKHLEGLITAHNHLFKEFFGQRHHHPGIELADSKAMTCTDGCDWYFHNGPYEWTKKPYTNQWWNEMNGTDWDWIRVREHIKNTIAETRKAIMNLDMFYGNVEKFLPAWVWYDNLTTWIVEEETENIEGDNAETNEEMRLMIRYVKTDEAITAERITAERRQRQHWVQEGMDQNEAARKPVDIAIDHIGVQAISEKVVFDGEAITPDWNNGGKHCKVGSWLNWWGFRHWFDDFKAEQAKQAATSSSATIGIDSRNTPEQAMGNLTSFCRDIESE
ncbi:hypothetical protein H2198_000570 [Neophaeococcomyces mojaviensis]|uniref:Uncharacterized protein n=1 Tax=Neophaeococcomyces mojaviensis TaxID=3383035 RepID=A0ACC3AJV2_9EURO|nr:hypothetical protein H2198_000570 [Knufia sp. JES_112]